MSGNPHPDGNNTPPAGVPGFIERAPWRRLPHPLRWLATALIGGTLIFAGIAMLVLPGPGLLSIVGGITLISPKHGNRIIRWVKRQYRRHIASRLHKR